jgi:hypothetical protein
MRDAVDYNYTTINKVMQSNLKLALLLPICICSLLVHRIEPMHACNTCIQKLGQQQLKHQHIQRHHCDVTSVEGDSASIHGAATSDNCWCQCAWVQLLCDHCQCINAGIDACSIVCIMSAFPVANEKWIRITHHTLSFC